MSLSQTLDLTTGISTILLMHPATGPLSGFTVVNSPHFGVLNPQFVHTTLTETHNP